MELTLHSEVVIDSAHKLIGYDGKCSTLHGHSWMIETWFKGDSKYKDKVGILVDFSIVKNLKDIFDHKLLNDVMKNINPTAENICEYTYGFLSGNVNKHIKVKVRVYETMIGKKTWCECGDW